MIKLTKKTAGDRLYVSPTYVSNGHWALTRDQLDPRMNSVDAFKTLLASVREVEDSFIAKVIAADRPERTWTLTRWLYERTDRRGQLLRVAVADDGARAYFDADYCTFLGLTADTVIYAPDADSAAHFGEVGTGVLMPVRHEAKELPAIEAPALAIAV